MDEWFDTRVPLMAKVFTYLEVKHIQQFQNSIKTQEYTAAFAYPLTWKEYVNKHSAAWPCNICNTLRGQRQCLICNQCGNIMCTDCTVCCSLCNSEMCHKCYMTQNCTQCFEY
jgi:hypothetical protein